MRVFLAPISTRPIDSKTVTWNGNLEAAEFLEKKTETLSRKEPAHSPQRGGIHDLPPAVVFSQAAAVPS